MTIPFDDIEDRLAACRPLLTGVERDKLLFQAAQANLKRSFINRTISYSVLSSILSAAACFGVMTYAIAIPVGESKIAGERRAIPATNFVERRSDHRKPFDSDIRLEIEARPRGVLTAASWVRWEAIDMLDQGNSSATREGILGRDDVESSPLSVRSKIPSF